MQVCQEGAREDGGHSGPPTRAGGGSARGSASRRASSAESRGVLVGHPGSWEQGYPDAGCASLYRFTLAEGGAPTGFGASPFLTLSGETPSWSSELGTEVAALAHPGGPLLAIGGLWGQGAGLDQGSAYVLSVPAVE